MAVLLAGLTKVAHGRISAGTLSWRVTAQRTLNVHNVGDEFKYLSGLGSQCAVPLIRLRGEITGDELLPSGAE